MSSIGTIYGGKDTPKVLRCRAVAAINGLKLDVTETSPMKGETRTPEYLAKFPSGKIPGFTSSEGLNLFEGRAIARYVAGISNNANLLGSDNKSAAQIEQWISFADDEVLGPAMRLFYMANGFWPYNKGLEDAQYKSLHRAFHVLQSYLHKETYLVGHRATLADLTLASNLQWAYANVLGKSYTSAYPHVARYYELISHLPQVLNVFGGQQPREEHAKFTPPQKEKKEKGPKPAAAAAAAVAASKSEKKKEQPKKKAKDDDDDDDGPPPEPKAAHPCASLPPSPFILDEAKRQYSNLDTKDFLAWFYEKFDKEGFSIWKFDFKYNDELTMVFMSANQLGGFFTRLEASRKFVMGAGAVYGSNNDSIIAGTAICRGKDWKPVLGVAPDIESYDLSPLDVFNNADDKKFFEENMAWEGEYKGKAFADGKFLK